MKSFSKLFTVGLALAGLLLAGCAPATEIKEGAKPVVVNPIALPLDIGSWTSVPSNFSQKGGENNLNATYSAMSLTEDYATTTNQWSLDYGTNTKKWATPSSDNGPARVPQAKAVKFYLKAVGPETEVGKELGQNAFSILTINKLTFTDIANKTGITFSIRGGGIASNGVKVSIRSLGTSGDVNANAWTAALNDAPNTNWDWVWFGHSEFVNFTVPFSVFSKAANATQTDASIAAAVTAGVVFDQLELSFRMDIGDSGPSENGAVGTEYSYYIDNVKLY